MALETEQGVGITFGRHSIGTGMRPNVPVFSARWSRVLLVSKMFKIALEKTARHPNRQAL
jgi:hypothetical protein